MYVVYRDAAGGYRWRLIDGNRRIVADSAEAYVSRDGAKRAIANVKTLAPYAPVQDS
jgi:uncharacterized protein YegP (UPF0339 family)